MPEELSEELSELIEDKGEWEDVHSFLLTHKAAMFHCDEDVENELQLCACMLRLAEWYAKQRTRIKKLEKKDG